MKTVDIEHGRSDIYRRSVAESSRSETIARLLREGAIDLNRMQNRSSSLCIKPLEIWADVLADELTVLSMVVYPREDDHERETRIKES